MSSAPKLWKFRLKHAWEAAESILEFTRELDQERFAADKKIPAPKDRLLAPFWPPKDPLLTTFRTPSSHLVSISAFSPRWLSD